ncbi:MAG: SurA N-terminal domain-containing protein [Deltaproteobacteria bacterium]|nr:SurA N-terminal domain-containing protein [Deltaproteobacteria bacterium]MBW2018218.1 SurA N-terminal domain-containing protein [Deltaproteobacteria bacterium]MBW2129842.1 SurA N-terminal domain-containing protein [Deltaproteobacteria bacterium]MBW2305202.1 SurA N-terminal domain-containing protein [Deltaproteobacteria bacterium]
MLLSLMRRHAKSYLIKILIAIIAIVFIFYFGYSFTSREGAKVATVNGELITRVEYQKAFRNLLETYQKQYKGFWNDRLIKSLGLKKQALDTLITEKLISQESRRIGLEVTDEEVQKRILSYPVFQFRGRFDEARYRSLLANNHMKPEEFEAEIARQVLREKVQQFISSFLLVTDREVQDYYTFANEQVKVAFVKFSPKDFEDSLSLDTSEMEKYFKEHRSEYRIPAKIKIVYIEIDPDRYRDQITVSDQQIKDYYYDNIERYKVKKQIRARHILFKLDENAPEDKVKEIKAKAAKILERAKKGEDFAALARKFSEGPTKDKGGDLGYFSKGEMLKPFEEAAFKLKKGEISGLVRTSFGFHIIKVEDIREPRTKKLEEVRQEILDELGKIARSDFAHEKALALIDQMPYDVDLEVYAKEHHVPVKSTDFFAENEPIPEIGGDSKLRKTLFSLEKKEITDLMEVNEKFYIFQVADKKPSYLPELQEVRGEVEKDFRAYLASQRAKKAAEAFLKQARDGKDWKKLIASQKGLTAEETTFFKRIGAIDPIGFASDLQEAAFGLDKDHPYPEKVFENEEGVYVIRWEAYKAADQEEFEKEKERYRATLFRVKQGALLSDWINALRKKAEIEILSDL